MNGFVFSFLLSVIIFLPQSLPQDKNEFSTELYSIKLSNNSIYVENLMGTVIFLKEFQNPTADFFDLDNDGNEELLVKEIIHNENESEYSLFIYNLIDSFYLSGIINSGITEPYQTFPGEIEGLIIVSGNPDFSYLSADRQDLNDGSKMKTLPVNCWKFEDGEIFLVNRELYEIFLNENEAILSTIENFQSDYSDNCAKSKVIKSLTASAYINYLNAGEIASAENFLKTFYQCDDFENFKKKLDNLFYKENE